MKSMVRAVTRPREGIEKFFTGMPRSGAVIAHRYSVPHGC
jgi:hypothetical protein